MRKNVHLVGKLPCQNRVAVIRSGNRASRGPYSEGLIGIAKGTTMKTNKLYSVLVLGGAALAACGNDDTKGQGQNLTGDSGPTSGGSSGAGGQSNATGGAADGGHTSGGTTSTGGRATGDGGGKATGGRSSMGGTPADTGGAAAVTGGASSTGGAPDTGGAPPVTGGAPATGGVQNTGGAPSACCPASCWPIGASCPCNGGVCCWLTPNKAGTCAGCPH